MAKTFMSPNRKHMRNYINGEIVATLKSQYGFKGGSDGVERKQLAFTQQWSSYPFLDSVGIHIRWNYRAPSRICT